MLAAYPDDEHAAIHRLLTTIARNEVFHVTYSMRMVCEHIRDGARLEPFRQALRLSEADRGTVLAAATARAADLNR